MKRIQRSEIRYAEYASPLGRILVARTARGVTDLSINLPEARFVSALHDKYGSDPLRDGSGSLSGLLRELDRYFSGRPTVFKTPLAPTGTAFDLAAWKALRSIPWGKVRTYGWIAERAGSRGGARAAGGACGRNPVPIIIPCHRIIRSDGTIGGYSGGVSVKQKLLALESAPS